MHCWQRFKVVLVVNCLELMISYYSAVLEQYNAVNLCCCECRVLCIYVETITSTGVLLLLKT